MEFYVEPSPSGAWYVKLAGHDTPVSRHDSEEEALARRDSYARGAAREDGELVELRDGSSVRIRPIRPEDKAQLVQAFDRLGDGSRYRRFLGYKKQLSVAELVALTEVDHHDHEALGAVSVADGRGVGVARYVRDADDPQAAEIAVTIVDEWQGRGLGTLLLTRLTRRARQEGITRFTALVADGNEPVMRLLRRVSSEIVPVGREPGAMLYSLTPLAEEIPLPHRAVAHWPAA
jgi:RimJ/RimL family protein N-acetyltransferase